MTSGRGAMQSDYMHWFKVQKPVRLNLSSSEVPHFRLDRLPLDIGELDLDGASHPRYAPLRDRIGKRYGVGTECVVAANGTSMANFLAMAALIDANGSAAVPVPPPGAPARTQITAGNTACTPVQAFIAPLSAPTGPSPMSLGCAPPLADAVPIAKHRASALASSHQK